MNDKMYSLIQPAQRTAALFAALARDDMREADRLTDTAPRQHYVGADFSGEFLRVMMVATIAVQRIDRAAIAYVAAIGSMSALAYRESEGWIDDAEHMLEVAEGFKGRMRSVWSAFRASVEPLGLDAFEVAETVAGLHDMEREVLEVEGEPDDELLATFRAMLGPVL